MPLILLVILAFFLTTVSAQTQSVTLFSEPAFDGWVLGNSVRGESVNSIGKLRVGLAATSAYRSFISFDVSSLAGSVPTSAILFLFLSNSTSNKAVIVDVVDYGSVLDISDMHTPAIASEIGRISLGSPGSKSLDVTAAVALVLSQRSNRLQLRLRTEGEFTGTEDFINEFEPGESAATVAPRVQIQFTRRVFQTIIPHFGDGPVPGAGRLRSTLLISNAGTASAEANVKFTAPDGTPAQVPTTQGTGSQFVISVPAESSRTLLTLGSATTRTEGWVLVETNEPVAAAILYQFFDNAENLVTEAGVGSARKGTRFAVPAKKEGLLDTGVAVANPRSTAAQVVLTLRTLAGATLLTKEITLGPNQQNAFFIFELAAGGFASFDGTLLIVSSAEVVVTSLRTVMGLPSSSLPVE
ncbi:MAG: hypothetical protein HY645_09825 [Acidobacteria bacterium]|nr:hypothetical protein [Acidobacteriota bacterium]